MGPGVQDPSRRKVVESIRERLAALEPQSLEIGDESALHAGHEGAKSGGGHYRVTIVSAHFSGKPLQARHRLIYDAIGPLMRHEIHALAIHAHAPGETQTPSNEESR